MLIDCGTKKACTITELRAKKFQLEMQLVVARLADIGAVDHARNRDKVCGGPCNDHAVNRGRHTSENTVLVEKLAQEEATIAGLRTAAAIAAEAA